MKRGRRLVRLAAAAAVVLGAWSSSGASAALANGAAPPAQSTPAQSGVVSGRVVDATGGAISGATVTLNASAGARETASDGAGSFAFNDVQPGAATLVVTSDRFAPVTLDLSGPARDLQVVLRLVSVSEKVTVTAAAAAALRTRAATRTDTPLRDVPQAVSIVTRDLIADQTMRSMADVVNYVAGVGMSQGEGHRDAPVFRGNRSTSDFFTDGIRDDTQYLRDLYNVERIEVLKGPNGMVFGRGGVGGVINRVTRQADWTRSRELVVQGGSWAHRRISADVAEPMNDVVAARLTGMYENSDTYRTGAGIERYGVNPTVAFSVGPDTTIRAGYEFFRDERTVDRGVPSHGGRPLDLDPSTFFGSAEINNARVTVTALSSSLEHRFNAAVTLRNHFGYADYDKFYQNLVPGAVSAALTTVSLTGYNSGTQRQNVFNQTDVIVSGRTGGIEHTLVAGVEVGRQITDNDRLTAFFPSLGPATTSIVVPIDNPTTSVPVEFRPTGTDANNHGVAVTAGVYAQDQVGLSRHVQAIVGVRYDRFEAELLDKRNGDRFASEDGLVSPRVALVYKPVVPVSLYASYSRSYLPRAGEQLSSLSPANQALDPENFRNYEAGVKWELASAMSLTTAVYRLDHGNVAVRDPENPTLSHLVDAERTIGMEVELTGSVSERWSVHGGYAYQDGEITRSLSSTALAGARLAQVPRHSFSMWNKYDISSMWGLGLGVISRSDSFVATDNTVVLPGFARVDAAVFFTISPRLRTQVNVENLFDTGYHWAAHSNNNIAPGSPRAVRVALTTHF